MKNLIIILFVTVFSYTGLYAQETNDTDQTEITDKKSGKDEYSIQVDGLGCPFCAYGLEKKFKDFKGIKNVNIEMETGMFTFTYPADKALSVEVVENKVEEAGYTAVNTTIVRSDGSVEKNTAVVSLLAEDAEGAVISKAIQVWGNCGMCEARIEKTSKEIEGVISADWDKNTKILMLEYDSEQTDSSVIEAAIAKSGHDTENAKADESNYNNLPACCLYERKQE